MWGNSWWSTGTTPTPTPTSTSALRFAMVSSTDHETPSGATPTVLIFQVGVGSAWIAPAGAMSGQAGNGWWTIAPNGSDQSGVPLLLLYATASGADPTVNAYAPGGVLPWTEGSTAVPFPIWMGTTASSGYLPAQGLTLAVQVSINGNAFQAGAGTVAEPGGSGAGNGFYLYTPAAAEVAAAGDLTLFVTASGANDFSDDFPIAAAE
jgi:hypothetical protein